MNEQITYSTTCRELATRGPRSKSTTICNTLHEQKCQIISHKNSKRPTMGFTVLNYNEKQPTIKQISEKLNKLWELITVRTCWRTRDRKLSSAGQLRPSFPIPLLLAQHCQNELESTDRNAFKPRIFFFLNKYSGKTLRKMLARQNSQSATNSNRKYQKERKCKSDFFFKLFSPLWFGS